MPETRTVQEMVAAWQAAQPDMIHCKRTGLFITLRACKTNQATYQHRMKIHGGKRNVETLHSPRYILCVGCKHYTEVESTPSRKGHQIVMSLNGNQQIKHIKRNKRRNNNG